MRVLCFLMMLIAIEAGASEKTLLEIEARRRAAIAAKDFATLEMIYAEDFRAILGNGEIADRAFLFNIFRNDDSTLTFTTDELLVREFGNAAIVTGRLTAMRGETIATQQRFSHFFVRRKGRWVIVAAEGTPVVERRRP
jgi:ketosteroid isomerase-like protein